MIFFFNELHSVFKFSDLALPVSFWNDFQDVIPVTFSWQFVDLDKLGVSANSDNRCALLLNRTLRKIDDRYTRLSSGNDNIKQTRTTPAKIAFIHVYANIPFAENFSKIFL